MNSIHGHEVLTMMLKSRKSFTRESLVKEIIATFGADTRFHTCSAENLTAQELVEFLDSKGKFVPHEDGGINTSADLMCKN
mgnify:CR=1 FL=1